MNRELHDSLFELYIVGGLELITLSARGLQRELMIDLETSALTPEQGEIIRYRAVNRFDPNDAFDEWARPSKPLPKEAERILGVKNAQFGKYRSSVDVLYDFCVFIFEYVYIEFTSIGVSISMPDANLPCLILGGGDAS